MAEIFVSITGQHNIEDSTKPLSMKGDSININGKLDGGRIQLTGKAAADVNPLPTFSDMTSLRDPSRPATNYPSGYEPTSDVNNKSLIVNGDFVVPQNVNFSGTTVFAAGNIIFESNGSGNNLNNCFFVAQGDITAQGGPNFGTSLIVAYGNLTVKGLSDLNGGAIIVGGDATFNGKGNFNYNANLIDKFVVGSGGAIKVNSWK